MRILYLINSSKMGGAEVHAFDLACGMVGKGYEVWVVLPDGDKRQSLIPRYRKCGVKLIFDSPKLDVDPFFIWRVVKVLRREKIEIVHTHQLKTTVNGIIAAWIARVPARIAHIHDTILQWEIPLWKKIPDIIVNSLVTNLFATHAIALTSQVKEWLVKGERINKKKVVIMPNGVDVKKFKPRNSKFKNTDQNLKTNFLKNKLDLPPETLLIGSLGRLTVEKGHIYFIEAIPKILSSFSSLTSHRQPSNLPTIQLSNPPTFHFVLVGDGAERKKLEQRACELKVEKYVTFLGFQPENDKIAALQSLDIFVFPSLREGFGIAMVEAMAASLPVVAADLPKALREIATEREVMYFEPKNPESLAKKVVALVKNPSLRESLGEKAWLRAKEYSLENFIGNYDKLYHDALV